MNRYRLFAKVTVYLLSVALVLGVAPVAAAAANPSATISPANHVFPSAVVGYDEQPVQTFTITNTGDVNLYALPGGWSGEFTGEGWGFRELIRPGESLTFDLRPNTNLPVGAHTGEYFIEFIPASDLDELDRIIESGHRLFTYAIASYLRIAPETVDAWGDAEWYAFWDESVGFYNSPIYRQWEEAIEAYWLSVGRILLRGTLSFTVTAAPIADPGGATSEPNYNPPPTDILPAGDSASEDNVIVNPNLNPPTGR